MPFEFHQVDAFTDRPFQGNPAAVYRLESWPNDELLQRIAIEHNLSETAFVVREGDMWRIRWFSPRTEVALCGHATLAAAHVLFEVYGEVGERLEFISQSGTLRVFKSEEQRLALDFPALIASEWGVTPELERALRTSPVDALSADKLLVLLESEQAVRECKPDLAAIARLPWQGVIITARGEEVDFVSRFFAPGVGLDEDPVTGSAHCSLIPYWSRRLAKRMLTARQLSQRGGQLWCRLDGDRVSIAGHAVRVFSGQLLL